MKTIFEQEVNKEVRPMWERLASKLVRKVYANEVTVAGADAGNDGGEPVKITHAIRMVYSREIEFHALPLMIFRQFATLKTELETEPGDTITMITYDNIKLGGRLRENENIRTQSMSNSEKSIRVYEYGNAISQTEWLLRTSFDDTMDTAATLLARDYATVVDCELRDTALSGTNVIYSSRSDGTYVTQRQDLDNTCVLRVSTIKDALEILATNNTQKFNGLYWICFVHPRQSRQLRDDTNWINAANYGAPEQMFTGEIGRIDDTRFIETTNMTNGAHPENETSFDETLQAGFTGDAENPAISVNVYQALVFGDNYYGLATGLPVELRDNGVEDFGRRRSLAWYSIFGTGLLNAERGVIIETAGTRNA
jgi:N4-gp56 family major capsid protein